MVKLLELLVDTLEMAQNHLEYCGWGDSWERECADQDELPEKIEYAINVGRRAIEVRKKGIKTHTKKEVTDEKVGCGGCPATDATR